MPTKVFAQFAAPFQGAAINSLLDLGQSLAAQAEKIARLQFEAGLESSRDAMAVTQALLEVKDADGLAKWQETFLQPNLDRASESVSQQYEVLLETRGILAEAVKQSTAEATRQIQENIDRIAKGAPEGFAPVFDAIRKSLDTQVATLETMGKFTDQFGDLANANLSAIKDVVQPVAKAAGTSRRKTA